MAIDAWSDSGLFELEWSGRGPGAIVGGYHTANRYHAETMRVFADEPDYINPLYAIHSLETTHAGCVTDVLRLHGTGMMVSAACASGLYALRTAVDEIRWHGLPAVVVVGAVPDFTPLDMHALALIGAISQDNFNDEPHRASRPFDVAREGFVPAHGGGAIVLEDLDHAKERGAQIYCELLGVETSADASHLPQPSEEGQVRAMQRALESTGIAPEEIDYINGHFTSTPLGDIAEHNAIRRVFGTHADQLKANATKSMIGHTMGASGIVELVGAILQVSAGRLHPSINVDQLDPAIDIDVCANLAVDWPVRYFMKNAFGFGGLNASAVLARSI
jgi:3-oxoacyl-(acyl-carrier-protein) synthase